MRKDWKFAAGVALLTLVAVLRVASTHRVFSATTDEPAHLGDGYHWFEGTYAFDTSHPPLARALCALPLRLAGVPHSTRGNEVERGNTILRHGGDEPANLARARSGNLVLFALAIVATAAWARRRFPAAVSLLAVALFTMMPPVLAHAGLITTDMAVTAALPLALLALEWLLDRPSMRRAIVFGAAVGLGLLAKLSFLVYFPAAAIVVLVARARMRPPWRHLLVAIPVALVVLWSGYRFSFGKPSAISRDAVFLFHYAAPKPLIGVARRLAETNLPAPAYAVGIAGLGFRDKYLGHPSYLLGETRDRGWWYYFPVLLFYKTPLPFLALAAWGAFVTRPRRYAGVALAVLLVAMTGSINIGLRHALPIYIPLSILAASAVAVIWTRATSAFSRTALVALLAWLIVSTTAAHPDYLPWFNELAQPNPAAIAVDSNLDWGQDAARLGKAAQEMGIDTLHLAVNGTIAIEAYGVRGELLVPGVKTRGWVAVSETPLALRPDDYAWLSVYRPVRRIGKSIRLYYIP
jgi:hypothetical protein